MFDLNYTRAVGRKILTFEMCPPCCLLPQDWIFCWPIFCPCLSGIWCVRCCRGIGHEFSPNCSVMGFMAVKLCVHTMLLIEAGCQRFFFHRAIQKLFRCVHVLYGRCMCLLFFTCSPLYMHFTYIQHFIPPCAIVACKGSMIKWSWSILCMFEKHMMGKNAGKSPLQDGGFHLLIWWESSWIRGLRHILLYNRDTVDWNRCCKSSHHSLSSLFNRISVDFFFNSTKSIERSDSERSGSGGGSRLWSW